MQPSIAHLRRRSRTAALSLALASAALSGSLHAQTTTIAVPPPQGVLGLSASASTEVAKDLMALTFSVTKDGADAGAVQSALKQALDAALAEARKVAKPREVEVQTGNFSLYPRYAPKGGINGWQGTAELVVQGRDMETIAQLGGRIQTMTIARVAYGLSREAQEKVESEVSAQAVKRFQARAAELAKQFGYGAATVREVQVSSTEPGMSPIAPKMYMRAAPAAAADESLPVEAGKATVSVTVNGTVQMSR